LYSGARRKPKPSGRHSRTPSEKIKPLFSVCARRIWKINSCLRMPLAPGMFNSLAILARSVMFFSLSSARLMLTSLFASEFVSFAIYPDLSDVVMIELDRVFPELDCVVVYLPAVLRHRQGGQTRLSSTGSSPRP